MSKEPVNTKKASDRFTVNDKNEVIDNKSGTIVAFSGSKEQAEEAAKEFNRLDKVHSEGENAA